MAGNTLAQPITLPQVPTITPTTDLMPIIPRGQPSSQGVYSSPAEVTVTSQYSKSTIAAGAAVPTGSGQVVAGYNNYFGNYQSLILLEPATTLTYAYFTMASAPSDGSTQCMFSTATVTTTILQAITGQTLNNGITAMTANTRYCYTYSLSNTTWDRSM